MNTEQKFLRITAREIDGELIGQWESWLHTPTWPGYGTKFVTEGSPDRIAEITEAVGQFVREHALEGRQVNIAVRLYESREDAYDDSR